MNITYKKELSTDTKIWKEYQSKKKAYNQYTEPMQTNVIFETQTNVIQVFYKKLLSFEDILKIL